MLVSLTVEVRGLTKSYGNVKALQDLSFKIQKGTFEVVLGPSGCGKTTLLRCIAGVEIPDKGEISINDQVVFSSSKLLNIPPEKRQVGMVYQSYALWPHMTVFENVAFPLRVRHKSETEIKDEVKRILELLNIREIENRYPSSLSGGQQQRVALARALVYHPPLLLLDEPLSGLDEPLRIDIARDLRNLHKQLGTDVIYVTHNREEAFWLSDHILLLLKGRLVAEGSGESLIKKPPNAYVASFLCDMILFKGKLLSSKDDMSVVATDIGNLICMNTNEDRYEQDVFVGINEKQIEIATYEHSENVFEAEILDVGAVQNDGSYMCPVKLGSKTVYITTGQSSLQPGTKIKVRLPPERCVLVPEQ